MRLPLRRSGLLGIATVLLLAVGCARGGAGAGPPPTTAAAPEASTDDVPHVRVPPPSARSHAIVVNPVRPREDRPLDEGRRPAELLDFLDIAPGSYVGELGAGGGYTTELLALAVGDDGRVYAQNSPGVLARFAAKPWGERLKRPETHNVIRADREFDDPFPPQARKLDLVLFVLVYHDTVWQGIDRDKMNRAVFAALRPGGRYVVVDHAARPGSGVADVKTFHRIEESVVRQEIEHAGFKLRAVGDFLRNPTDTHDWNDSPTAAGNRRGTSDRFVLDFVKPGA